MTQGIKGDSSDGEIGSGLEGLPDDSFLSALKHTSRYDQENLTDGETRQGLLDFPDYSFVRQKDLQALKIIPFSSATLWRRVGCGRFPRPIKISPQITVWRVYEVKQWLRDPAGWQL